MMKKSLFGAIAASGLAFAASVPAHAQTAADRAAAAQAPAGMFAHHAAHNGIHELMLSYLALQKSTDPEVREFSKMMVDHHGTATAELMKMMGNNPMPLPITPRADQLAMMQRLSALSGADFKRAYFDHQVEAHGMAIRLHEQGMRSAHTPELARFAARTLPLLRAHLQIAEMMRNDTMGR